MAGVYGGSNVMTTSTESMPRTFRALLATPSFRKPAFDSTSGNQQARRRRSPWQSQRLRHLRKPPGPHQLLDDADGGNRHRQRSDPEAEGYAGKQQRSPLQTAAK
jgi:hypothetical protein